MSVNIIRSVNENKIEFDYLLYQYQLSNEDKEIFYNIVFPIFCHDEFQRRMNTKEFSHHGDTSLGKHILCDAIVSYLIAKRKHKKNDCDVELATIIAMFHDLYELPWQNSGRKVKNFIHKHGFTHPLEAVTNAYMWYPEYFTDFKTNEMIIDGVVHHMWPFPVLSINDNTELNNMDKYEKLPSVIKNILIHSSSKNKINVPGGSISICRANSYEGRVISLADKIITCSSDNLGFYDTIALVTGKNKNLEKKK